MKKIILIILLCLTAGCESGYDEYDLTGYNNDGYDREGYTIWGYNKKGYNRAGFNREGYNRKGKYNPEYDERLTALLKSRKQAVSPEQQIEKLQQQQIIMDESLSIADTLADPENFTYRDSNIVLTLEKVYVKDDNLYAEITLLVTRDTIIIRPKTCRKATSPDGSVVDKIPQGITMLDNFGNSIGLVKIEPCYYRYDSEIGIRPQQRQLFTIRFNSKPLNNTDFLVLEVAQDVFGNIGPFVFLIPGTAIIPPLS